MEKKLILASSSPRRREILKKMGLEFEVVPSDYEEILEEMDFTYEKIEELARKKAESVLDKMPLSDLNSRLVIGADTVVVLNNQILGKPENKADAVNMLKQLSGKKHSVVTSICVINSENSKKKTLSTASFVEFKNLDEDLISNYVEKYNPLDKAGAYGIQELPEGFVNSVEGSFENIIGLCPSALKEILSEFE